MAEVFLAAWDVAPRVQRPVVIKRLYTHFGDDPNLVQMFIDEARLACALEHENIVKTIEVGVIDDNCCIAMEYLAGQSLQQLHRRSWVQGGIPINLAVYIAIRALDALGYAHEARDHRGASLDIVHRDISPHNILITNNGHVKLLDFGIAKAKSHEARTATGYVKGKLAYIAPEQAQAEPVDKRADIWSVGVVLWEMLAGTRLFRMESDAATLAAVLGAEIAVPSSLRPEVPPELDQIILRALERERSLRYPSAFAMKCDLEHFASRADYNADMSSLAMLMRQYFSEQMAAQRRLIFDLLDHEDGPSVPSTQTPTGVRATHAVTDAPVAYDVTSVDSLMDQVSRNHKFVVRTLLSALLFVTAIGAFAVFTLLFKLGHTAPAPASYAMASKALETQPARRTPSEVKSDTVPTPEKPKPQLVVAAQPRSVPPAPQPSYARPLAPTRSASAEMGTLNLDTTPWSLVSMNGKSLGQTPLLGVKLPAGTHVLTLRNPDLGLETKYAVNIESGKVTARRVGLQ